MCVVLSDMMGLSAIQLYPAQDPHDPLTFSCYVYYTSITHVGAQFSDRLSWYSSASVLATPL